MSDFETNAQGAYRSTRGPVSSRNNWPWLVHPRDRAKSQTPNTTQPAFLLDVADWPTEHAAFNVMVADTAKSVDQRFRDALAYASGQGYYIVPSTITDGGIRSAFTAWVLSTQNQHAVSGALVGFWS